MDKRNPLYPVYDFQNFFLLLLQFSVLTPRYCIIKHFDYKKISIKNIHNEKMNENYARKELQN